MRESTIFLSAFCILMIIAFWGYQWRPHVIFFTSLAIFLFFIGLDILTKKDFKSDFAIKFSGVELKLNNLGIILLIFSAFSLAIPLIKQDIFKLERFDALFNYKTVSSGDIEGSWEIDKIYWKGEKTNEPTITKVSCKFS